MTGRRIDGRINPKTSPVIQPNRTARERLPRHIETIAKIIISQQTLAQSGKFALAF
jgi:type II secretory ATPase GspE/PulE/Tfp pilus assembly ATPase PilB-like protein